MVMATSLQWQHLLLPTKPQHKLYIKPSLSSSPSPSFSRRQVSRRTVKSFQRSDFDGFAKKISSGEAWKDVWRSANDNFELLVYEAKKTAESINRRYDVSRRFTSVVRSASDKAKEIDHEYEIGQRWRSFSIEFGRNLPRYRRQLGDFLDTPLGRSFATIFFIWFALSGWLFRVLIFATWVLPFAGPLLIGTLANNLIIRGECPSCKRQFIGNKNQMVRCAGCGNTVWQPKNDFFSKGGGKNSNSSKSQPDIIDVEFEEK